MNLLGDYIAEAYHGEVGTSADTSSPGCATPPISALSAAAIAFVPGDVAKAVGGESAARHRNHSKKKGSAITSYTSTEVSDCESEAKDEKDSSRSPAALMLS